MMEYRVQTTLWISLIYIAFIQVSEVDAKTYCYDYNEEYYCDSGYDCCGVRECCFKTGSIAGIVVGVVVFKLLICCCCVMARTQRRRQQCQMVQRVNVATASNVTMNPAPPPNYPHQLQVQPNGTTQPLPSMYSQPPPPYEPAETCGAVSTGQAEPYLHNDKKDLI